VQAPAAVADRVVVANPAFLLDAQDAGRIAGSTATKAESSCSAGWAKRALGRQVGLAEKAVGLLDLGDPPLDDAPGETGITRSNEASSAGVQQCREASWCGIFPAGGGKGVENP
jgi:hypothetical protein